MALNYLDYSQYQDDVNLIHADIFRYNGSGTHPDAFGYYYATDPVGLAGNKIQGYYLDLFGGGGGLSIFQFAPSLNPNGVVPDWETKKRAFTSYQRTAMRLLDSDFYFSTENCEEGLIGVIDIHHSGGIGESPSPTDWGQYVGSFGIVYSRFQCMFTLAIALNDACFTTGSPSTQAQYYTTWVQAQFHFTGGHMAFHNQARGDGSFYQLVPLEPPGIANCPMYYMLVWMQGMVTKMDETPMIRKYMRLGLRMRPLPESWEGDYVESGSMLSTYLATVQSVLSIYYTSSVWILPEADDDYPLTSACIGIVITGAATEETHTYNIYMQAEAYDLSPNTVKVLYQRVGATRTELTRFTDVLDYDHEVVFDSLNFQAPCDLLEIVTL